MAISAAERNRRKREKKKAEKKKKKIELEKRVENNEEGDNESGLSTTKEVGADTTASKDKTKTEADLSRKNDEEYYVPEPLATEKNVRDKNSLLDQPHSANDENPSEENIQELGRNDNNDNENDDENDIDAVMRRFASRANVGLVSSDDEEDEGKDSIKGDKIDILLGSDDDEEESSDDGTSYDSEEETNNEFGGLSRRKLRELTRPTVAELKQRVKRPELVEAHDVTSPDPIFLLHLKSLSNTVPVPRHWGRKRKYLQGKRGIEKPPFQLPQFLINTGVGEARSAQMEAEDKMSLKQKQRSRVQVRGGVDVDYKTLHDAFFKYQTKPTNMTKFGDLYYEGKEYELAYLKSDIKPGKLSSRLRDALGMTNETSPPPWLTNMQRYGPPPSYPGLIFPGVNAPLPEGCSYGYHVGGWGKPPVDAYGRGLYGDVFGPPIADIHSLMESGYDTKGPDEITGDGKRISRSFWGVLPDVQLGEEEEEDEGSSDEGEETSEEEEDDGGEDEIGENKLGKEGITMDGILPPPPNMEGMESVGPSSGVDLRKTHGEETPMPGQQGRPQLYQVLETKQASKSTQAGALFQSDTTYVLPGGAPGTNDMGAESVLSKAVPVASSQQGATKRSQSGVGDEDDDGMTKKFKF